jgi:hypothetical protein
MKTTWMIIAVVLAGAGTARAQHQHQHEHGSDAGAVGAVDASMGAKGHGGAHALHLAWTARRTPSRADSVRADSVAAAARRATERFRDVRVAEAEGFKAFAPKVKQEVYHYTNWQNAIGEAFRFDVAKPTSLLYRKTRSGAMELVGVMYAAPARASEEQLDARVPLSIARWHRHVNLCVPPRGEQARWLETRDGTPLFGPESAVATREGCEAVGGRFLPQLFGWMVHANVFAADARAVWREEW